MEILLELKRQALSWRLLPVSAVLVFLTIVGSGVWKTKWKRTAWVVGLGMLGAAFALGVVRGEWGEVLFHGNIL